MSDQTVTKKQVREALTATCHTTIAIDESILNHLFPELPKRHEMIFVWNKIFTANGEWRPFLRFHYDSHIVVEDGDGEEEFWENYRRQTPTEKGEG
jgi:hypothetical protein